MNRTRNLSLHVVLLRATSGYCQYTAFQAVRLLFNAVYVPVTAPEHEFNFQ